MEYSFSGVSTGSVSLASPGYGYESRPTRSNADTSEDHPPPANINRPSSSSSTHINGQNSTRQNARMREASPFPNQSTNSTGFFVPSHSHPIESTSQILPEKGDNEHGDTETRSEESGEGEGGGTNFYPYHEILRSSLHQEAGYVGYLSVKQQPRLDMLREAAESSFPTLYRHVKEPSETVNHYLLRFLRSRRFNVKKAFLLLQQDIIWREGFDIEYLASRHPRIILGLPDMEIMDRYMPWWHQAFDRQGRPVFFELLGNFNISEVLQHTTPGALVNYHIWQQEYAVRQAILNSRRIKCTVDSIVYVIDASLWSMRSAVKKAYDFFAAISEIDSAHYPERLGTVILINTPFVCALVWKVISQWIDERTRQKIQLKRGPSQYVPLLRSLIDPDQLPTVYGGNAPLYCSPVTFDAFFRGTGVLHGGTVSPGNVPLANSSTASATSTKTPTSPTNPTMTTSIGQPAGVSVEKFDTSSFFASLRATIPSIPSLAATFSSSATAALSNITSSITGNPFKPGTGLVTGSTSALGHYASLPESTAAAPVDADFATLASLAHSRGNAEETEREAEMWRQNRQSAVQGPHNYPSLGIPSSWFASSNSIHVNKNQKDKNTMKARRLAAPGRRVRSQRSEQKPESEVNSECDPEYSNPDGQKIPSTSKRSRISLSQWSELSNLPGLSRSSREHRRERERNYTQKQSRDQSRHTLSENNSLGLVDTIPMASHKSHLSVGMGLASSSHVVEDSDCNGHGYRLESSLRSLQPRNRGRRRNRESRDTGMLSRSVSRSISRSRSLSRSVSRSLSRSLSRSISRSRSNSAAEGTTWIVCPRCRYTTKPPGLFSASYAHFPEALSAAADPDGKIVTPTAMPSSSTPQGILCRCKSAIMVECSVRDLHANLLRQTTMVEKIQRQGVGIEVNIARGTPLMDDMIAIEASKLRLKFEKNLEEVLKWDGVGSYASTSAAALTSPYPENHDDSDYFDDSTDSFGSDTENMKTQSLPRRITRRINSSGPVIPSNDIRDKIKNARKSRRSPSFSSSTDNTDTTDTTNYTDYSGTSSDNSDENNDSSSESHDGVDKEDPKGNPFCPVISSTETGIFMHSDDARMYDYNAPELGRDQGHSQGHSHDSSSSTVASKQNEKLPHRDTLKGEEGIHSMSSNTSNSSTNTSIKQAHAGIRTVSAQHTASMIHSNRSLYFLNTVIPECVDERDDVEERRKSDSGLDIETDAYTGENENMSRASSCIETSPYAANLSISHQDSRLFNSESSHLTHFNPSTNVEATGLTKTIADSSFFAASSPSRFSHSTLALYPCLLCILQIDYQKGAHPEQLCVLHQFIAYSLQRKLLSTSISPQDGNVDEVYEPRKPYSIPHSPSSTSAHNSYFEDTSRKLENGQQYNSISSRNSTADMTEEDDDLGAFDEEDGEVFYDSTSLATSSRVVLTSTSTSGSTATSPSSSSFPSPACSQIISSSQSSSSSSSQQYLQRPVQVTAASHSSIGSMIMSVSDVHNARYLSSLVTSVSEVSSALSCSSRGSRKSDDETTAMTYGENGSKTTSTSMNTYINIVSMSDGEGDRPKERREGEKEKEKEKEKGLIIDPPSPTPSRRDSVAYSKSPRRKSLLDGFGSLMFGFESAENETEVKAKNEKTLGITSPVVAESSNSTPPVYSVLSRFSSGLPFPSAPSTDSSSVPPIVELDSNITRESLGDMDLIGSFESTMQLNIESNPDSDTTVSQSSRSSQSSSRSSHPDGHFQGQIGSGSVSVSASTTSLSSTPRNNRPRPPLSPQPLHLRKSVQSGRSSKTSNGDLMVSSVPSTPISSTPTASTSSLPSLSTSSVSQFHLTPSSTPIPVDFSHGHYDLYHSPALSRSSQDQGLTHSLSRSDGLPEYSDIHTRAPSSATGSLGETVRSSRSISLSVPASGIAPMNILDGEREAAKTFTYTPPVLSPASSLSPMKTTTGTVTSIVEFEEREKGHNSNRKRQQLLTLTPTHAGAYNNSFADAEATRSHHGNYSRQTHPLPPSTPTSHNSLSSAPVLVRRSADSATNSPTSFASFGNTSFERCKTFLGFVKLFAVMIMSLVYYQIQPLEERIRNLLGFGTHPFRQEKYTSKEYKEKQAQKYNQTTTSLNSLNRTRVRLSTEADARDSMVNMTTNSNSDFESTSDSESSPDIEIYSQDKRMRMVPVKSFLRSKREDYYVQDHDENNTSLFHRIHYFIASLIAIYQRELMIAYVISILVVLYCSYTYPDTWFLMGMKIATGLGTLVMFYA